MATHSSILAWRIPWTEEPGRLQSMGSQRVRHDRVTNTLLLGFPVGASGKESACSAEALGLIPGLGRSPGEGKGYPLQYSVLENSTSMGSQRVGHVWVTSLLLSFTGLTGLISLQSKGLSRVFSNTTVRKHQFFGTQPSLWSNSHIHTWLLEKYLTMS